ncbi:1-aminocyclopropane-1-carboxylate deaminase [Nitratiruptor tergarcus]|uniref:1-aminocyclopropane-1-carboxylate deaminase/D-cysteine desulfhydrase, PLP-dependent ACC family n=1 Tax=Nitratiruptor tergarcus DSM 16512 TaxID=1069081 RepID=A0A1W1WSH2_9BACT|nr:1-aminocyclopropane-1-carboxylate deaminase [Nitratiruptor tergarcus]SMC09244.1 1-aminocyclopropane-1-carboxylate deaminase/D-cysteine desulfhydrase, PLP-dependent ACC family [Nitratiruptor tergarcus DSM 16512]
MKLQSSPIQKVQFEGYSFYLKRDDLLHPDFSGNKARKLYYFFQIPLKIKKVISYGSMQSNAMYSLAVLAKMKGWQFEYHTRINEELLQNPKGNLKAALEKGMKIIDIGHLTMDIGEKNLLSECKIIDDTLIVPEGVRCKEAEYGIKILAQEIIEWANEKNIEKLNIFLPSGTGTTALYLQKTLSSVRCPMSNVYTVPCVGDKEYLKKQFFALEADEKFHPTILEPPKRYRFGKLYEELFEIWLNLKKQTGVEFDLLYDPIAFSTILSNLQCLMSNAFLYIHQGGVLGNITMEERYKKKFATIS